MKILPDIKQLIFLSYSGEENFEDLKEKHENIRVIIKSNFNASMPVKLGYDRSPINPDIGVILAAFVLMFLYGLIIWEVSQYIILRVLEKNPTCFKIT